MSQGPALLKRLRCFALARLARYAFRHSGEWGLRGLSLGFSLCVLGSTFLPCLNACADEANRRSLEIFENHVRPALVDHCIRCHGPDKQQGGLRLDTADGWAEGGDSGAAITPGDQESLLLKAIGYDDVALEMPPRGKLPDKTIAAFSEWVKTGAADPRKSMIGSNASGDSSAGQSESNRDSKSSSVGRDFWSFQPVRAPAVPIAGEQWAQSDIDHFVFSRLQEQGLTPNPDVNRFVWLRRLYFDLTGLPPSPEEIEAFVGDESPVACETLVDRLLDSKHFGERWGRNWLDVVRFAESSGGGRTLLFPDAWRFRYYVIDSFNRDLPYDQFLTQQIAGDLLECEDADQRVRNLTATAFLLLGPINYEMQDKDILEMDIVDEQLDTIGKAFMGMTIGCARCHDHKFDPIPTRDYYAMAGIFKSTRSVIHSNVSKWNTTPLPRSAAEQADYEQHQQSLAKLEDELKLAKMAWTEAGGKPQSDVSGLRAVDPARVNGIVVDDSMAEIVGDWTESTHTAGYLGERYIHDASEDRGAKRVIFRPAVPQAGRYQVLVSYSASANRSKKVPVKIEHADGHDVVRVNQKRRPSIGGLFESLGDFDFEQGPAQIEISNRGTTDGVVIADAVVFVPAGQELASLMQQTAERMQSEDELARIKEFDDEVKRLETKLKMMRKSVPKQPALMATVDAAATTDIHVAIRGQAHLKGDLVPRGVLGAASWGSFPALSKGTSGRKELAQWISHPQHPLTARVMVNRIWYWLMGRGLVSTVDNFGSMGSLPSHPELLDHLASQFVQQDWSIKRLIREIVLSRTYRMDSKSTPDAVAIDPGNRWYWRMNRKRLPAEAIRDSLLSIAGDLDLTYGGSNIKAGTSIEYGYQFTSTRRSVYVPVFRNHLPEVFEVFDFADPNTQSGSRTASAVASQSLWMMNHPNVIARTEQAARQLLDRSFTSDKERIRFAHLQVLSRPPTERELTVATSLIVPKDAQEDSSSAASVQRYAMLYRVLFQCLAFRYLD